MGTARTQRCVHSISVFFPAYNDAESLPALIATIFDVLRCRVSDYEVIVVNDGSTDRTAGVLTAVEREYAPHLRVVTHTRNLGYGAALRSGFKAATKDWVFYTDGDGQFDPAELNLLLDAATSNTGLVNGYKVQRQDPWHRVMIGFLYNRLARALFRVSIRDIDCDFRLMRRDLLDASPLQSTSGTVCVELVRKLEQSGAEVLEVPVSHYPRLHGRSQFFRVRSLASTFLELCGLFYRLVLIPAVSRLFGSGAVPDSLGRVPSVGTFLLMTGILLFLSVLTYARAVGLPFIADDYVQIDLARRYGAVSTWPDLASDALYRCRATSLVMTYWTERLFGLSSPILKVSSLSVHVINSFLVFLLGMWRPVGWRLSAVAACIFAVSSHHQEAVMWYAALPELLVFTFTLCSFLCWVACIQSRSAPAYAASLALFLLALLSKESAVVAIPLMIIAALWQRGATHLRVLAVAPFAILGGIYFLLTYSNRDTHLHFNDGTFSLQAPFWGVVIHSTGRLLWVWGAVAVVALGIWRARAWRVPLVISFCWMILTLLPYSFLTYMARVPSRHMYLASVGMSLLVACGLIELWNRTSGHRRQWAICGVASLFIIHQVGYVWTKKHQQFLLRAEPTEHLVSIVDRTTGPVYLRCFPYDESIAILAVRHRARPENRDRSVVLGSSVGQEPAFDLCNAVTGRGRF